MFVTVGQLVVSRLVFWCHIAPALAEMSMLPPLSQLFFQPGLIAATQDKLADEIRCPPGCFAQRDAEADEISSVRKWKE